MFLAAVYVHMMMRITSLSARSVEELVQGKNEWIDLETAVATWQPYSCWKSCKHMLEM